METSGITIKAKSGSYTLLDKKYEREVKLHIKNSDENYYNRWVIYNNILNEFINLNKINYFEEFKYRFTDREDPNYILIDLITRNKYDKDYFNFYLRKLNNFIDEDIMNRFL